MAPRVTIALPVRDAAPWITTAVGSILTQTFEDWELLVIDDGSTDGTADQVRAFRDSRIRISADGLRLGLSARLNQAIQASRTSLFGRMDGDDIAYPERLARQIDWLDRHPECDVVATHMLVIDLEDSVLGRIKWRGSEHSRIAASPWSGFHFNHATWLGRTSWFRRYGYRTDAVRSEDDDLMLRSYRESHFERLSDVLYAYRVGPLRLDSILTARRSFMRSLLKQAIGGRNPVLLFGLPLQVLKGIADIAAIKSGLGLKVLRHRAGAVLPEDVDQFERVLAQVHRHVSGEGARPLVDREN